MHNTAITCTYNADITAYNTSIAINETTIIALLQSGCRYTRCPTRLVISSDFNLPTAVCGGRIKVTFRMQLETQTLSSCMPHSCPEPSSQRRSANPAPLHLETSQQPIAISNPGSPYLRTAHVLCTIPALSAAVFPIQFRSMVSDEILDTLTTAALDLVGAYSIPRASIYSFTTFAALKDWIWRRSNNLMAGASMLQYFAVCNVSSADNAEIDERRAELPGVRTLHDEIAQVTIVKIVAGAEHELAGETFGEMLHDQITLAGAPEGSLLSVGCIHFGADTGGRNKQADMAYRPRNRIDICDWPSVAVEVGEAECLSQLRADAAFWIEWSGGTTRIVIVLAFNKQEKCVRIERWQAGSEGEPVRMQTLRTYADGRVAGAPLLMPAELLYDTMPAGVGDSDFRIDAADLAAYAIEYWKVLS